MTLEYRDEKENKTILLLVTARKWLNITEMPKMPEKSRKRHKQYNKMPQKNFNFLQ